MRLSPARFAVTAGLTAALALGGCSYSSSSETTTTVSDGETTTTTTTTTENGETTIETSETTTADAADQNISELTAYTLDAYGIRYELPEGFTFTEVNTDLDLSQSPEVAFQTADDADGSAFLRFFGQDDSIDVWDETFLEERMQEAQESVEESGATLANISQGEIDRDDRMFPVISVECEKDGAAYYIDYLYFSINDEDDGVHAIAQLGSASGDADTAQACIDAFTLE